MTKKRTNKFPIRQILTRMDWNPWEDIEATRGAIERCVRLLENAARIWMKLDNIS